MVKIANVLLIRWLNIEDPCFIQYEICILHVSKLKRIQLCIHLTVGPNNNIASAIRY